MNKFASIHPELLTEYCKDNAISIYEVSCCSKKKAWWECPECKNQYEQSFLDRHHGHGCPKCGVKKRAISKRTNVPYEKSLSYMYPEIAMQLNESANGISPNNIYANSKVKYEWICDVCGQQYKQSVYYRTHGQIGCPNCQRTMGTSLPEQIIFYYISQVVYAENRSKINGMEIDIYIPSMKIGIEYNGEYYHREKSGKDKDKIQALNNIGVKVYTVKEHIGDGEWEDEEDVLNYKYDRQHQGLKEIIEKLCERMNIKIPYIDIRNDIIHIRKWRISCKKDDSFEAKRPDLVKEFDYNRNGDLSPWAFAPTSAVKVWWTCQCGNSYQTSFSTRYYGSGCPICSMYRYSKEELEQIAYNYMKEHDKIPKTRELNDLGIPSMNTFGMRYYDWKEPFINAAIKLNKKVTLNNKAKSFVSDNSKMLIKFDFDKNKSIGIYPDELPEKTHTKKVWWVCEKGHSYDDTPAHQFDRGCPICSGRRVVTGINDFATLHPELVPQYSPNNTIKINEIAGCSGIKALWICECCGKEYSAQFRNRVYGTGCPYCKGAKIWETRRNNFLIKQTDAQL